MSYTVFVSVSDGRIVTGYTGDQSTADGAVAAILAKNDIKPEDVRDAVVVLGMTGSTILHRSKAVARKHVEPTQAQLQEAFNLVKDPTNWKNRVNKVLPAATEEQLALIADACIHFGAGSAEFRRLKGGKVRVTAPGYYMTIGS